MRFRENWPYFSPLKVLALQNIEMCFIKTAQNRTIDKGVKFGDSHTQSKNLSFLLGFL